jgi:hypothetical protein
MFEKEIANLPHNYVKVPLFLRVVLAADSGLGG